jgi:hypothetical protein
VLSPSRAARQSQFLRYILRPLLVLGYALGSRDLLTKRILNEDNPLIRQQLAKYDKLFPAPAMAAMSE